jgi:hypothetical protein
MRPNLRRTIKARDALDRLCPPLFITDAKEVTMRYAKTPLQPVIAQLFSLALSTEASWAEAAALDPALSEP